MNENIRPLVSFALIAYNQEKFIREAVKSAFAQTYQPLEIVLSDDCSSDRTFSIMMEMANEYSGPHKVTARQTPRNMGVYAHVMNVAEELQGELIVLSAGDDISKKDRTVELASAWKNSGAWGLHSRFDRIDTDGVLLAEDEISEALLSKNYSLRQYFHEEDGPVDIVHGVTSAYDKKLFAVLRQFPEQFILSEDGVFSFAINLLKMKVCRVDKSLVLYREHCGSLTNSGRRLPSFRASDINGSITKAALYSKSLANRTKFFLTLIDFYEGNQARRTHRHKIVRDHELHSFRAIWPNSNLVDRVRSLKVHHDSTDLIWMAPRILGPFVFVRIKMLLSWLRLRR